MDWQGISSPVFHNNDGVNNYITKPSFFDPQQQMQGAQSKLQERIENLSIDLRESEARKMDYINNKLSEQKEEQDAMMEEIRTLFINSSPPSSSSRRRRSSHKSSERKNDASASLPHPHLHGDHHHVCDPHRHEGQITSKHHVHNDDERHRAQARQRHHHHEDARQAQMHKYQQALLHAKANLHEHKRRPRDEHHQDGATAAPTTSASSPSVLKASSPLDVRHLCLLPMSSPTLTSHQRGDHLRARETLPSSEAPQERWTSMGISLRSWR